MPKMKLDIHEERFCELVACCGYRETDAAREVWPALKLNAIYTKVKRLGKRDLVRECMKKWNDEAMEAPRRRAKLAARRLEEGLKTAQIIMADPEHKQFSSVLSTVAKLAAPEIDDKDTKVDVKWDITIKPPVGNSLDGLCG